MDIKRTLIAIMVVFSASLLASCGRKENSAPRQQEASTASALPESSEQLLALLPKSNEVAGWTLTEKPRFFGPGNLWEFIDGAADGYLAYGFQDVVSADYAQDKMQLVVDIYRMKDATNAFGIYAQERNPESQFIKVGVEGYFGGTALNFWAGSYYVKLTAFEEQESVKQEMLKIAGYINGKLTAPGAEPAQVSWFPKQNQVARSAKYIPKDVLGQSYFGNAFELKYKAGSSEYKLLLVEMPSPDGAREAFAKYKQFIANQRKAEADLKEPGTEEGFSGEDSFYGPMMAVHSGAYVIIALGIPSPAVGHAAFAEILNNTKTKSSM